MNYTINSDTWENYNDGMCETAYCYDVEAMSAIDAVIKASKNARDAEDVICCDDQNAGILVYAYRHDGNFEFHVYHDEFDEAFTI